MSLSIMAEHFYAECRILFIIMLNVVVLSVIVLSVVVLSVVAPVCNRAYLARGVFAAVLVIAAPCLCFRQQKTQM